MHNLIACSYRVISGGCISHIRYTSGSGCNQFIPGRKRTAGHCNDIISMSASVISPLLTCCGNRDGNTGIRHRQFTIYRGYRIVSCSSACELIGFYFIGYRAFIRESDASGYNSRNRIISDYPDNIISGVTMRSSVIGKLFTLCGYRHCFRINCQRPCNRCDDIVISHIFVAVHNLIACSYRVISGGCIRNICNTSGGFGNQRITGQKSATCYRYSSIRVSATIICPSLACRSDSDGNAGIGHRQLTIYRGYRIVPGSSACKLIA